MELKVEKSNALKAWNKADQKGKVLLENLYGKQVFENQKVTDRIKTFEDALSETGRPDVPDFSHVPYDMRKRYIADYKLTVIAEALNEGWTPDWDNSDQYKYRPWFVMSPSSFAFNFSYCDLSIAFAGGGSRLHFPTSELARYIAEQFLDLWKDLML